jgi:hypothetical protein
MGLPIYNKEETLNNIGDRNIEIARLTNYLQGLPEAERHDILKNIIQLRIQVCQLRFLIITSWEDHIKTVKNRQLK